MIIPKGLSLHFPVVLVNCNVWSNGWHYTKHSPISRYIEEIRLFLGDREQRIEIALLCH